MSDSVIDNRRGDAVGVAQAQPPTAGLQQPVQDRQAQAVAGAVFALAEVGASLRAGLSDPRAAGLLAQLQDSVRKVSLQRTGSPEGALQLQQRIPIFRRIMAATGGLSTSAAAS